MNSLGLSTAGDNFEFLQLLVAQLQNQDPIDPVDQESFVNQLTSFSTLEAVEGLNAKFDDILQLQQITQGFELAGKEVRYVDGQNTVTGKVDEVSVVGAQILANIDGSQIPISNIISVLAN